MQLGLLTYKILRKGVFYFSNKFGYYNINNIIFCLTYQCNSRCVMCDIWKIKNGKELFLKHINNILNNKQLKRLKSIGITGGEPFLREDIVDVYKGLRSINPKCNIVISTNGLLTNKILDFLDNIKDYKKPMILISIDGINKHNIVRGLNDAFERTTKTISKIRVRYPNIKIGIKFTIMPWNYDEIINVYKFCNKHNLEFMPKLVYNLKNYTNMFSFYYNDKRFSFTKDQINYVTKQLRFILKYGYNKMGSKHALFIEYMIRYLNEDNFTLGGDCTIRKSTLFIAPEGDVYTCRKYDAIGNIDSSDIDNLVELNKYNKCTEHCNKCMSQFGYDNGII